MKVQLTCLRGHYEIAVSLELIPVVINEKVLFRAFLSNMTWRLWSLSVISILMSWYWADKSLEVHELDVYNFLQGWDDVGFHGSPQIPTPNIDALAKSGTILNSYYVAPSSYATKAEFMTGKYASKLGKFSCFQSICSAITQERRKHLKLRGHNLSRGLLSLRKGGFV